MLPEYEEAPAKILLVDDEATNLKLLQQLLHDDYKLVFAKNAEDAIKLAKRPEQPQLILMDVMMPGTNGFVACKMLKEDPETAQIPVIFISALREAFDETRGFEVGGVDYIVKPFSPAIVKARIKNHLSLIRSEQIESVQIQLIKCLGRAAEFKENETGAHIERMSYYSRLLAKYCGFSDHVSELFFLAAPMHDLGKIGVPEEILLKKGKLNEEEFAVMKKHPQIGAEILGNSKEKLIRIARNMALYHHEKWDGSGYPFGLKGDAIPIEARIVAIADVFDALLSRRPYKEAWTLEQTMDYIISESGRHFAPNLVSILDERRDEFQAIRRDKN